MIAIGITVLTGNPLYDALGSIGVGLVLMASALFSMSEIKSLLVGESAHQRIREEMHAWPSELQITLLRVRRAPASRGAPLAS
ncbi:MULTISPECIES: hypothetical protein [Paraburkholderia]|uniref:hypothetical protein n=1 Tax=Paraburkholderia TaxID=1822464 RepID=UPI0028B10278|nr:hypothetical protein [Paraburkholderia podalyriae]